MKAAPLVYIYGDEPHRIDQALARVEAEALSGGEAGLNREVFTAPEADPAQVLNAARTVPFLAAKRLLIVRNAHRWPAEAWKTLLPYLESPSPSTCLVFVAERLDRRTKAGKLLASRARLVACQRPREAELPGLAEGMARELGLRLDPRLIQALVLRVGPDLGLLHHELDKLRAFAGEGGRLTLEDVEELVGESRTTTVFALCDALGQRRLAEAVGALRRLLGLGEPPVRLLYMIVRHFRHLWMARELLDKGGRVDRKAAASALGVHPFVAGKALEQARGWPQGELREAFARFLRADLVLKRGGGPEVLESLVTHLCRPRSGA